MLEPAFGVRGFEFEFRNGFDGVAERGDFGVPGGKLVGCVDGAGEGAVDWRSKRADVAVRAVVRSVSYWMSMSGIARRALRVGRVLNIFDF